MIFYPYAIREDGVAYDTPLHERHSAQLASNKQD